MFEDVVDEAGGFARETGRETQRCTTSKGYRWLPVQHIDEDIEREKVLEFQTVVSSVDA